MTSFGTSRPGGLTRPPLPSTPVPALPPPAWRKEAYSPTLALGGSAPIAGVARGTGGAPSPSPSPSWWRTLPADDFDFRGVPLFDPLRASNGHLYSSSTLQKLWEDAILEGQKAPKSPYTQKDLGWQVTPDADVRKRVLERFRQDRGQIDINEAVNKDVWSGDVFTLNTLYNRPPSRLYEVPPWLSALGEVEREAQLDPQLREALAKLRPILKQMNSKWYLTQDAKARADRAPGSATKTLLTGKWERAQRELVGAYADFLLILISALLYYPTAQRYLAQLIPSRWHTTMLQAGDIPSLFQPAS